MAKSSKDRDRAERIEAMRRESARAERRRTTIVVLVCGVVGLVIVGATGYKLYSDSQRSDDVANTALAALGVDADTAGCADMVTEPAPDDSREHVDPEQVDYPDSPPAYGQHWGTPAEFGRKFYTAADRPEAEQLVHNLEHGYTILWYDETVAGDDAQLQVVEDLAAKFDGDPSNQEEYNAAKFIAAPWTEDDGEAFPDGAHVAITRWLAEGEDATAQGGLGAWQYCEQPSGEALQGFMDEYAVENSWEPNQG